MFRRHWRFHKTMMGKQRKGLVRFALAYMHDRRDAVLTPKNNKVVPHNTKKLYEETASTFPLHTLCYKSYCWLSNRGYPHKVAMLGLRTWIRLYRINVLREEGRVE